MEFGVTAHRVFPRHASLFVFPRNASAEGPLACARGDKKIGLGVTKKVRGGMDGVRDATFLTLLVTS